MDNEMKVEDQNAQQTGQYPVIQSVTTSEKPKTNYLLIGGVVLACFIFFGFGGYFLGKQSTNSELTNSLDQQTPTPIESSMPSIPNITNTPIINKTTLAEVLAKHCVNDKITLDKLPFSLSESIKTTYKIQNTIDCTASKYWENSYASIYTTRIDNPQEFNKRGSAVYFFH